MSDSETEIEKPKKVDRRVGRKPTEAQLEGLRKGMAVIKEKREKLAKEREEHEAKKAKGEVPEDAPAPKYTPKPKIKPITVKPREVVERFLEGGAEPQKARLSWPPTTRSSGRVASCSRTR